MTTLVSLLGEQVVPILLPILYLRPERVVLVATERMRQTAQRLNSLLSNATIADLMHAFEMPAIYSELTQMLENLAHDDAMLFNLTGGTKPMVLAAYQLARERGDGWLYLQSQGVRSLLHRYDPAHEPAFTVQEIPALLTLDLFLRAHLGQYQEAPPRHKAEETVLDALRESLDECKTSVTHGGALEIDLVLRCGNQVGIAEVKTGKKARSKDGIDQLTTAAEQRYLGTYTRKYLILDRKLGPNNRDLAEAHRIAVVELPSLQKGDLSKQDSATLLNTVLPSLGCALS